MRHCVIVLIAACCLGKFSFSRKLRTTDCQNIQAKGGIDKIKAIKTLRMTGKFEGGGGFTAAVTQENERPNLIRETFSLQGMTAVQAYDGTSGWQIQPFGAGKNTRVDGRGRPARPVAGRGFRRTASGLQKEKGNTVEYLGHDVVDGDRRFTIEGKH